MASNKGGAGNPNQPAAMMPPGAQPVPVNAAASQPSWVDVLPGQPGQFATGLDAAMLGRMAGPPPVAAGGAPAAANDNAYRNQLAAILAGGGAGQANSGPGGAMGGSRGADAMVRSIFGTMMPAFGDPSLRAVNTQGGIPAPTSAKGKMIQPQDLAAYQRARSQAGSFDAAQNKERMRQLMNEQGHRSHSHSR